MFTSVKYVLTELIQNRFRIYSIAKYDVLAELHDTNLGLFWKFCHPTIRVLTYWFAFGFIYNKKDVDNIPYLAWMFAGMICWFFIAPCISEGCSSIHRKSDLITKMKFPVSILPMTFILENLFDHACIFVVNVVVQIAFGNYPSLYWLEIIYYLFCSIFFMYSLALITSVLNMFARDTKKFIASIMRLLFYLSPVFWSIDRLEGTILMDIVVRNPMYYMIQGYRDAFFYHRGILAYGDSMRWFWGITIVLFCIGSTMMYKCKSHFIDTL